MFALPTGARAASVFFLVWVVVTTPSPIASLPNPPCHWCAGLTDGLHANRGVPPSSGFFRCRKEALVRVHRCPPGHCFSGDTGTCGPYCAPAAAAAARWLPVPLHPKQRLLGRWRELYVDTGWPQVNALLAFKEANRDPHGALSSWVVPRDAKNPHFICSWKGVTCAAGTSTVTSLVVNNPDRTQALWGDPSIGQSIPGEFSALTGLQALDLSYNGIIDEGNLGAIIFGGLIGPIPRELGRCTALSMLSLQYNALTGPVPDSLGALTGLSALDVSYNRLSGPLPPWICTMRGLSTLGLSWNGFEGGIPAGISALQGLQSLALQFLGLNGSLPSGLGRMHSLTSLQLSWIPGLDGSVPGALSELINLQSLLLAQVPLLWGPLPQLSTLQSLTFLTVSNTSLSGPLPSTLPLSVTFLTLEKSKFEGPFPASLAQSLCDPRRPVGLDVLSVSTNRLSGSIPLELSRCSALGSLNLGDNMLDGAFPPLSFFTNFRTSLSLLSLNGNRLTGLVDPSLIEMLPAATQIDISSNELSGPPPRLACPEPLTVINLANNSFAGAASVFLAAVADCKSLGSAGFAINISLNRIYGRLPDDLLFENLTMFNASGNLLSGPIPIPVPGAVLASLDLSGNRLSGYLPAGLLRSCPNLNALDLSHNRLSGPVPGPLATAPNSSSSSSGSIPLVLKVLSLAGNSLSGPIPGTLQQYRFLTALDVSDNGFTGGVPAELGSLPSLQRFNASVNRLSGPIPSQLANLQGLESLSLQSNALEGGLPPELAPPNLPNLTWLDLGNNSLSGSIPYGFANLSSEVHVDLSFNNFSGPVPGAPDGVLFANPSTLTGNPGLCGGGQYPACPAPPAPSAALSAGAIAGISVAVVGGLLVIAVGAYFATRYGKEDPWSNGILMHFKPVHHELTAKYIERFTDGFGDTCVIGRGGFGSVYRVELPDGTIVAVKRLAANSTQGDKEVAAELQFLGNLSHRNLVLLLAAYIAPPPFQERLLVYEYLSGGSLDKILGAKLDPGSPFRRWEVRRCIALDVARGLSYLHHSCDPPVIHRDMKPANVILGEDLVARVADFGLAADLAPGTTHKSSEVVGTLGFLAPECAAFRMGLKSDVYAFGVTLLQLITGRAPSNPEVEDGYPRWSRKTTAEALKDPDMVVRPEEMAQVLAAVHLGIKCVARVPCDRPGMQEVVYLLENLDDFAADDLFSTSN